jgi:hypothetical protein
MFNRHPEYTLRRVKGIVEYRSGALAIVYATEEVDSGMREYAAKAP